MGAPGLGQVWQEACGYRVAGLPAYGRAATDFHAELVASGGLEEPTRLDEGLAHDVSVEDASKDRQDAHRSNGCGVTCLLLQREKHALAEVADDR